MMEVGRACVKLAGRDAGKKCVILDVLDDTFVLIDGETRRRKCNIKHLEPLKETLSLKKGASHQDVAAEFKKMGIELKETKQRQPQPKQRQIRAADRKAKASEDKAKAQKKETKTEQPKNTEEKPKETKLEKEIREKK